MTSSDFARSRRQQQVIGALWNQVFTFDNLIRAPKLWTDFRALVDTDLSMLQAVRLAYMVHGIGIENTRSIEIGSGYTTEWITPGGAQVLLPKTEPIQGVVQDLLWAPE
jgi:anionic cell wall polymer biosynthesis LytR-Cps2A-Psr (LCP) family protein